jgi:hypothetical protein
LQEKISVPRYNGGMSGGRWDRVDEIIEQWREQRPDLDREPMASSGG